MDKTGNWSTFVRTCGAITEEPVFYWCLSIFVGLCGVIASGILFVNGSALLDVEFRTDSGSKYYAEAIHAIGHTFLAAGFVVGPALIGLAAIVLALAKRGR